MISHPICFLLSSSLQSFLHCASFQSFVLLLSDFLHCNQSDVLSVNRFNILTKEEKYKLHSTCLITYSLDNMA